MNRLHPQAVAADVSRRTDSESRLSAVSRLRLQHRQRGVALVITVIMLAVITFLAIAFLVLSRREKGAVTTQTEQLIARNATDAATDRAIVEMLAPILAWTNEFAYDLRVSTNYINWLGFQTVPPARDRLTNVNYVYPTGQPVSPGSADFAQLAANLFYDPRPPVFVKTNRNQTAPAELRYYLDLNRNRRYDTNGFWPVIDNLGAPVVINGVTNRMFFVGDPEWVGVTERPEFPHSPTNRFVARWAYIAIPAGKTIDFNYIHNQAKMLRPQWDGFLRNMGLGPWEINLASFLVDLNTNFWQGPNTFATPYVYVTNRAVQSRGAAFEDAASLIRYRYDSSYNNLRSAAQLFGPVGRLAFGTDGIDGYSDGPLLSGTALPADDDLYSPNRPPRVDYPWSGADNPNHFFTTQELFDKAKTSPQLPNQFGFTDRLQIASTNTSSYDRHTLYRLLSQLGTDSEPEPPGKMNLNYDNLVQRHPVTGVASATNFYAWRPLDFFTNAAERLVRDYTAAWRTADLGSFVRTFGTNRSFGVFEIPVWVNTRTQFVYEAGVHRLLQLAANLYDATTTNLFPSVFRPRFSKRGNDIFVTGFEEASTDIAGASAPPLDIVNFPANRAAIGTDTVTNVVDVPWIVGAKKGFPNFNEFTMRSVVSVSRRLLLEKNRVGGTVTSTNQCYFIGVSNTFGIEAWNSYLTAYPRPLEVLVGGTANVAITNASVVAVNTTNYYQVTNRFFDLSRLKPPTNYAANTWGGLPLNPLAATALTEASFRVLSTNVVVWPDRVPAVSNANAFPVPFWRLHVKARPQYVLVDRSVNRIVDYVHPGFEDAVDIMHELTHSRGVVTEPSALRSVWNPTRVGNSYDTRVPTYGTIEQIQICLGNIEVGDEVWTDYNADPVATGMKIKAIDGFRVFMGYSPFIYPPGSINVPNRLMQAPYNPARKFFISKNWQANDPLVHYLASDLFDPEVGRRSYFLKPYNSQPPALTNLGTLNERYRPWGGRPGKDPAADPEAYNLALKDPLVRRSDDWSFPAHKLPTVGWMGRVHRGTPWQTVYLKYMPTNDLPLARWQNWVGNSNTVAALFARPDADRSLPDLFTVALNDNASRGRMSINQSGLAAWSAVLSGVIALSNKMDAATYLPSYPAQVIAPAGAYDSSTPNSWPPVVKLVAAINDVRATNFAGGVFRRLGDILAVPELTLQSPFLNVANEDVRRYGIHDAVYEWLPQQVMSLLTVGSPRFVIYAYGQTLRPANNSIVTGGPFFGLCTNYQITAEAATRSVVRIEGAPGQPRAVVESFNLLPPD